MVLQEQICLELIQLSLSAQTHKKKPGAETPGIFVQFRIIWSGRRCCLIGQVAAGIVVGVGFVNY